MSSITIIREGQIEFSVPQYRALLRDARLSWAARGLFAFLWDLPTNWSPNSRHLATMGPDGKHAVRSCLRELEAVGGLRMEKMRNPDAPAKLAGTRWVLVSPDRWAKAAPLASHESLKIRPSIDSSVEEAVGKVHKQKGSATENNNVVVVFSDESSISVPSEIASVLYEEVEAALCAKKVRTTAARLAAGILKNWQKNGIASSAAADARKKTTEKKRADEFAHLRQQQSEVDTSSAKAKELAAIANKKFSLRKKQGKTS